MRKMPAFVGVCLVAAAAAIMLRRDGLTELATPILQTYFSRDGVVDARNLGQFRQLLSVAAFLGLAVGSLFLALASKSLHRSLWARLLYTGEPPIAVGRRTVATIGVVTVVVAVLLPIGFAFDLYVFQSGVFREDGPAENLTALLFGAAAVVCVRLAFDIPGRDLGLPSFRFAINAFFPLCAFGCFFIAMEEISWGQRILGFGTPTGLSEVNVQGEFNLHNLANPIFFWIYLVMSSGILVVSMASAILHGRVRHRAFEVLAPHPNLAILALALWGVSTSGLAPFREVVEILAGLYAVCYAGLTFSKARRLASLPVWSPEKAPATPQAPGLGTNPCAQSSNEREAS